MKEEAREFSKRVNLSTPLFSYFFITVCETLFPRFTQVTLSPSNPPAQFSNQTGPENTGYSLPLYFQHSPLSLKCLRFQLPSMHFIDRIFAFTILFPVELSSDILSHTHTYPFGKSYVQQLNLFRKIMVYYMP